MQTVARSIARGVGDLSATSDSPRADAQILFSHVLGHDREWIVAHADDAIADDAAQRFAELCKIRSEGMPIAYIVGSAWFCGREFLVNESVLVPRPQTEHLVDEAVAFLRGRPDAASMVLDVGTGSGAMACSIAAEVPSVRVDGTDLSAEAIATAQRNARTLGVADRCTFHLGDLAFPVSDRAFDVIVANLPYVPSGDVASKPDSTGFEPLLALDGGPDGLTLYRRFLAGPLPLARGGLLLIEGAPPVMDGLLALARAAARDARIDVRDDYGGRARYLRIQT
jgi:release factor glutamine methyltransferase